MKIVDNFETFPNSINTPSYGPRIRGSDLRKLGCSLNSVLDRSRYLGKFGIWAHFQWKTDRTWNIKIIDHFIAFLTRGRAQGFDIGWKNYGALKLDRFSRYDFELESIFKFLLVFNSIGLDNFQGSSYLCKCQIMGKCQSYKFLTKRKVLPNIDSIHIIGGKSHSSL
jgi:hypothetical protein